MNKLVKSGMLAGEDKGAIMSEAGSSSCGKKAKGK